MRNVSNQNFFIDSKAFVGWLCWGRPMKALQPGQIEISLQQNEVEVAKVLGRLVTREWLDGITTCLVNDNEFAAFSTVVMFRFSSSLLS